MNTETGLLLLSAAFLLINTLALDIQQPTFFSHWLHFGIWLLCAIGGWIALNKTVPTRDPFLFPIVMLLSGWGIIIIDRLAPRFADRQTIWLLLSTATLIGISMTPSILRWLRIYRYLILLGGITLLISTILLGRNPTGLPGAPELWLGIGNLFFQPSEAIKVLLVAFLASYLAEQYPLLRIQASLPDTETRSLWFSPRILGPIVTMWSLCMVIVVWQRDLGTAALFFAVFLILLYVASGQLPILIGGGILLTIAGFFAYQLFSVVALRVDIWINPWPEADGRAFQVVQSLMAFAAGGIWGTGIAQGAPTYIPVVHSDFIFSAIAEEYGLVGTMVVIACIAIYVVRGLRIAMQHQSRPFYSLLATGLSMLICIQSIMIMAGVLKLLPLTGVTLPFVSYGGSSMLMTFVISGLLIRLSSGAN